MRALTPEELDTIEFAEHKGTIFTNVQLEGVNMKNIKIEPWIKKI